MRTLKTTAVAAIVIAALGSTSILPSFAQVTSSPTPAQTSPGAAAATTADTPSTAAAATKRPGAPALRQRGMGPGIGMLNFNRGAEAVEIALVRLSHRIELTQEQQPLFDTFRTEALSAAEELSTKLESLRPAPRPAAAGTASFDPSQRLARQIEVSRARLEALEAVQPAATAFFDSLTDEQLSQLQPQRREGGRRDRGFGQHGERGFGHPGDRGSHGPTGGPRDFGKASGQAPRG